MKREKSNWHQTQVFWQSKQPELRHHRTCYMCKPKCRHLDHLCDQRCPSCAALNYEKRMQTADPRDHVAIITGVRGSLDILINSATQMIRRPVHYYKHLLASEGVSIPEEFAQAEQILRGNATLLGLTSSATADPRASSVTEGAMVSTSSRASAIIANAAETPSSVLLSSVVLVPDEEESTDMAHLSPQGQVDTNNQFVDLRTSNSWVQKIDQIETMELVEVFAINTTAPFILNKRAIPLIEKIPKPLAMIIFSKNTNKFIVNVSAMKGNFYHAKMQHHPHTNMAKDLAKRGIS